MGLMCFVEFDDDGDCIEWLIVECDVVWVDVDVDVVVLMVVCMDVVVCLGVVVMEELYVFVMFDV